MPKLMTKTAAERIAKASKDPTCRTPPNPGFAKRATKTADKNEKPKNWPSKKQGKKSGKNRD